MGAINSKISNVSNNTILQLFNLFQKNSMFYENSKLCFPKLIETIYNRELKQKKKNLERLSKMEIADYIKEKKLLNENSDLDKKQFIKLLSLFSQPEINQLLQTTKKNIFLELKKDFD